MALSHETAARNAAANAVVDLIDGGTGVGELIFTTTSSAVVSTVLFAATAFKTASAGSAVANALTDDTNAAGGTVALFRIAAGTGGTSGVLLRGTVNSVSADITISSTVIGAGDTVSVTSLTYTAAT